MLASNPVPSTIPALFEHEKRKDWGVAFVAWEHDDKRGYLFEDGELRVVASPFYELLHQVERPAPEVEALFERLRPQLLRSSDTTVTARNASNVNALGLGFVDQWRWFHAEYPQGFAVGRWLEEVRGVGPSKQLKRYRDASLQQAQNKLSKLAVDTFLSQRNAAGVWEEAMAVLKSTDLVPPAQLKGLDPGGPEQQHELATALRQLLYGEGPYEPRFGRFLSSFHDVFGKDASWQLATTLTALVFPADHIAIQPTGFREQAKWVAPKLASSRSPSPADYARFLEMAKLLARKLTEQGAPPTDLMDVMDFVCLSTRPAARASLLGLRQQALASQAAASGTQAA